MLFSVIITSKVILLRYARPDEEGYQPRASYQPKDGDLFVDLDSYTGGCHAPVTVDRAHDFKTVEAARRYIGSFQNFTICEVEITYNVKDVEHV